MKKEQIKIGTPVIYYPVITDGKKLYPKQTEITSDPWELGHGEVVCKVKGVSGGVSIKHLEPNPDAQQSFLAPQPKSRAYDL